MKKKNNYPAKSVFLAGTICFAIGLIAFVVSAIALLLSGTQINLVGASFSTIFKVIGGVFSLNPTALAGNAMTIAAIGIAFIGFLVGVFFIVDFARVKNLRATIASSIGTISFLLICLVLECYVVSRTNGGARIRAYGGMAITAAPLALSLLACLIYQIVSYVEKVGNEATAIAEAEAAPLEEETENDTGFYTDEELRATIKEEIEKVLAEKKEEPIENITEDKVKAIVKEELDKQKPIEEEKDIETVTEDKVRAIINEELGKQKPAEEEKKEEPVDLMTEEKVRAIIKDELDNFEPITREELDESDENQTESLINISADAPSNASKAPKKRRAKFETKIKKADKDLRHKYYDLRDYIKSYGVNNRVSIPGDTFSLHRERYAFITIVGSKIKVYLPLNVQDYANSPIPVEAANAKKYEDLPMVFKVKSDLSFRRAKKLIDDVMAAKGLQKPAEPEAK